MPRSWTCSDSEEQKNENDSVEMFISLKGRRYVNETTLTFFAWAAD